MSIVKWTERRSSPVVARFKSRASLFVSAENDAEVSRSCDSGASFAYPKLWLWVFCGAALLAVTSWARTSLETGLIAVFVLHVSRFANSLFVPHAFCLSHLRARRLYRRLGSFFFFPKLSFQISFFPPNFSPLIFSFHSLCLMSDHWFYVGVDAVHQ